MVTTHAVIAESHDPKAKRIDFLGIVTFSPGLFLLIWSLIDGNEAGWATRGILLRLTGAGLCLVAFVMVELHQQRPMVDFSLFRRSTFLGSVFAMIGYGATAQVMVFYLPLFLQNAYGFEPAKAGLAMIPFALPMVIAPRFTARLASRFSGRATLTAGLAVTFVGNLLFWMIGRGHLSYPIFSLGMVVAGIGAGMLNGETVKVLGNAVPPERAGMASGLASTTRFIGILVGVAGLGAVLASVARNAFVTVARNAGLDAVMSDAVARRVTSGDLAGMVSAVPGALLAQLHSAGRSAFADGFGAASLLAAVVAAIACALTFRFVRSADTSPANTPKKKQSCMAVDCRNPI